MEVFEIKTKPNKGTVQRQTSSHGSRSKMMFLFMIGGAAFVTCCALILFNFVFGHKQLTEELELMNTLSKENLQGDTCEVDFCYTLDCVASASRILDIMDTQANPCQDFYQFACGGYGKTRAVRYNEDYYSPVKEASSNIMVEIKKLMEKPSPQEESPIMTKTKALYKSCMNSTRRDEDHIDSLMNWFAEIELAFKNPYPENVIDPENYGSWRRLISKLEEYKLHTVLRPEFKQNDQFQLGILDVDCLVPKLLPETYLNPDEEENAYQMKLYKEVMERSLKILGIEDSERKEIVEAIIELETNIASTIQSSPKPNNPTLSVEHKQEIKEIWRALVGDAITNFQIRSTCGYNLENILSVLNNATPKKSYWYVIWLLLTDIMKYMGTDLKDLHDHYLGRLPGVDHAWISKWRECSEMIQLEMGWVAAKGFFEEGYFTMDQLAQVNEMFWELKTDFAMVLRMIPWMDEVTRGLFLEKLKNIKFIMGYSEFINQTGLLDVLYDELEIGENYFVNMMNLKYFKTRRHFQNLWQNDPQSLFSKIDLQYSPLGWSSKYDYLSNTVTVDLSLLVSPLYRYGKDFPNYMKYGQALILAKELSHAFDIIGNFIDGYGNKMDLNWWPEIVGKKFNEFVSCLIGQLANHLQNSRSTSTPITNLNRTEILNNNIGDLGSIFTTYAGLMMHLRSHGVEEKPLPGITLNKKQLYFIQAAQMLCEMREKPSSEPGAEFILPARYRVNNAVSNTEDFGNVFECPLGTPMNPEKKCNLLH